MLIDVSNHQGTIDWSATDPAIDGAYIKVTEGASFVDGCWLRNHDAITAGGKAAGAYHFADLGDPVQEANHFADQYLQRPWQLRPVLDIETSGASAGWITSFRAQFRARTGHAAFRVYTSRSFLQGALAPGGWIDPSTDIWLAAYASSPGWDHPALVLWQNSEAASVPGVLGNVDSDQFMHGWTPAADQGAPDMQLTDTFTDWAGNTQRFVDWMNHVDQRLAVLFHDFEDAGSEPSRIPGDKNTTNLRDMIMDSGSWSFRIMQAVLALAPEDPQKVAAAIQPGLAAAVGPIVQAAVKDALGADHTGEADAIVAAIAARLSTATPTPTAPPAGPGK